MKIYYRPNRNEWDEILKRPAFDFNDLAGSVSSTLADVKANGDEALRRYTAEFDKCRIDDFAVSAADFAAAEGRVDPRLKESITHAIANIRKFHSSQVTNSEIIETTKGVFCWQKAVGIEKVGLYVPAGTASLFSTVLMLAVPASLAGCREIVLCSPPNEEGRINDAILYAASICGVTKVFKAGGAQAIAAMAYGTETIPKVYKIFGPGNRYVTCAKQLVSLTGTAIDMPAGPSEVAVLADDSCVPAFVAADLLSQAEHGVDSQVLLVATSETVIDQTMREIEKQFPNLSRRKIAGTALQSSTAIVAGSLDEGVEIVNEYAAEHLILAVENAEGIAGRIKNAGSVFLGNYSCESAGDYASGTNHTLPTNGSARAFSGLSLDSFVKKITFQRLTAEGVRNLGPVVERMAMAEGLDGHRRAMSIRREEIDGV
jgi:histidinol dehydrogenase